MLAPLALFIASTFALPPVVPAPHPLPVPAEVHVPVAPPAPVVAERSIYNPLRYMFGKEIAPAAPAAAAPAADAHAHAAPPAADAHAHAAPPAADAHGAAPAAAAVAGGHASAPAAAAPGVEAPKSPANTALGIASPSSSWKDLLPSVAIFGGVSLIAGIPGIYFTQVQGDRQLENQRRQGDEALKNQKAALLAQKKQMEDFQAKMTGASAAPSSAADDAALVEELKRLDATQAPLAGAAGAPQGSVDSIIADFVNQVSPNPTSNTGATGVAPAAGMP